MMDSFVAGYLGGRWHGGGEGIEQIRRKNIQINPLEVYEIVMIKVLAANGYLAQRKILVAV